jgi:hypothetical protein
MRKRNRAKKNNKSLVAIGMPPAFRAVTPQFRSVRLTAISAVAINTSVTVHMIARFQSMAITASTAWCFAYAIRLKRVRIWFSAATTATPVTAALEWNAGATGFLLDGVSVSATTMSTTEVCVLDTKPPTESLAAWYQSDVQGGTNQLFQFGCPAGSLIQVDFDWVPGWTEPQTGTFATAGATVGQSFSQQWNAGAQVPVLPIISYA